MSTLLTLLALFYPGAPAMTPGVPPCPALLADRPLAWQAEAKKRYLLEIAPRVRGNKSPYVGFPTGLPAEDEPAFRALHAFLKDEVALFDELQAFERDVVQARADFALGNDEAFLHQLDYWEPLFGFAKAHHETKFLPRERFMELLAGGHPIFDDYFVGKPHTVHGHRVVSILCARHLARRFGDPKRYAKLYRVMGSKEVLAKIRWKDTGIDESKIDYADPATVPDPFGYFHDSSFFSPPHFSIDADDFTNPLFVALLRKYVPGLSGWK